METFAHVDRGTPSYSPRKFLKQFPIIIIFLVVIGSLSYPSSLSAEPASVSNDSPAEKYMVQGLSAFQRGAFEQAILDWRVAVKLYKKEGKSNKQQKTLALLAQAYQYLSLYVKNFSAYY